jgi:hypothetical protein
MLARLLINIILLILLNGCIGFHQWTSEVYDPLASIDEFPYVFTNFERANNFADSYDRRLSGTKLKKEHFLSQKIDSILNNIEAAYTSLNQTNIFNYYKEIFNYCNHGLYGKSLCPKIDINIYALSEPIAVSFPNGRIHLSRSIIDGNRSFSTKNSAQLTGLIAHEFIHIKHGHLRYQWAIADAFNNFKRKQRKTNWSKYLHYLPIYAYSNTIYSTRDLSEIYFIDFHLECMADFYTALLLDQMGYSIEEYIELLKGLYSYVHSFEPNNERILTELRYRVYFLQKLMNLDNIILPNHLVIIFKGQMQQDDNYIAYSLTKYPILKKYAVYWGFALNEMGKKIMGHDFVIYENHIALPVNKVNYPNHPLNTKNGNIMPLGVVRAIALPYRLVKLPIFPFFNQIN